jgi:hypothetical protein
VNRRIISAVNRSLGDAAACGRRIRDELLQYKRMSTIHAIYENDVFRRLASVAETKQRDRQ